MLERSPQALAGGVSSPFRAKAPVPLSSKTAMAPATDVDGNEYIDYQLAWGPMILGYAHPAMVEAAAQVGKPLSYGRSTNSRLRSRREFNRWSLR